MSNISLKIIIFEKILFKETFIFKTAKHLNHDYTEYVTYIKLKLRFL